MIYNLALFLHIFGVLLMFSGISITMATMVAMLYSKNIGQICQLSAVAKKADGLIPLSVLLIIIPGLYMVITTWGWKLGWIDISIVVLIIMTVMGPMINLKRIKEIENMALSLTKGRIPEDLNKRIRDKILWRSVSIMTLLAFSIVFLMVMKTGFFGSLLALFIAILIGAIIGNAFVRKGKIYKISDRAKHAGLN